MKVLIVGGGGREHALAWGLAKSPLVDELLVAPGNAGIASLARCLPVAAEDVAGLVRLIEQEDVELTVVGPEAPLVAGLTDRLRAGGRMVFGPNADAARIEGSKAWAKDLMLRHRIPTARAGTFEELEPAVAFVDELDGRAVVKADGLAAGKGVTVCTDRASAISAIEDCVVRGAFGSAGSVVLVEEILEGPEVSAFALCDGRSVVPLACSQDAKRVGDGDTGPNTGGMGAYSPLPFLDGDTETKIWDSIVEATVAAMAEEGATYHGLLYAGVMLTAEGPKALEFNCRFGDPETQVVVPRLRSDLAELLLASADGGLESTKVDLTQEASVAVVLASGGYPGPYETGVPIAGLEDAARVPDATLFHAGTAERDGRVVSAGGRVLAVSALGATLAEARGTAYAACERISYDGMHYRKDIAARAVEGETT